MPADSTPPQHVPVVDCALYEDGRRRSGSLPLDRALEAARNTPGSFVWVGLHEPTADQLQFVARVFGLRPLAVEDALNAHQRPKLERYDDTLFLVLRTAVHLEHDRPAPTTNIIGTGETMAFAGRDFIVVVRHDPSEHLGGVRRRLKADPERLALGPASVLHAIADSVVDQYLDVLTALETDVEEVENYAFSPAADQDIAGVYQLEHALMKLRRTVTPLARPLHELAERRVPGVPWELAPYFRDVADHLAQAAERVTALTELVGSAFPIALAQAGNQQNDDMRRISAAAALIAIPVAVAGVYGMNFDHMPELRWRFGYPIVLGVIATACFLLHRGFKRNGWL